VKVDRTVPSTTATLTPLPNADGWNKANVTVKLVAATPSGTTPVQSITYSASGAQPIASTTVNGKTTSVVISGAGETTLTYAATDAAGNVETPKSVTIRLDKTLPSCSSKTSGATITYTLQDSGSGLRSITPTLTNATAVVDPFTPGRTSPVTVVVTKTGGTASIKVAADDLAGTP